MTIKTTCCWDCALYDFNTESDEARCLHPFANFYIHTKGLKELERSENEIYKDCPLKNESLTVEYVG